MWQTTRRGFLRASAAAAAGLGIGTLRGLAEEEKKPGILNLQPPGTFSSPGEPPGVEVINPQGRVPLSLFIDDSTCLVNMGHFCMPQFAEAWSDWSEYKKDWKRWPREIPNSFVH